MKITLKFISVILLMALLAGCNVSPSADDKDGGKLSRPQTIFEGVWTWEKTDGDGIAGPYKRDSVIVGYSLHYDFGFSELQTYRNNEKYEHFAYSFATSEKPELQKVVFKDDKGSEQSFLWEIKNDSTSNRYLFLRNVEPCCDNSFEQQFRLIQEPKIQGK